MLMFLWLVQSCSCTAFSPRRLRMSNLSCLLQDGVHLELVASMGSWAVAFNNGELLVGYLISREIKTHQQSLVMVKRIMAIAVSGITYLRGIFPEDAYSTHYLEDLCVKVLREDSIYPRVSKIVKWMKACFEALEKKYLQMMILGVSMYRRTQLTHINKKTNLTNDATEDIKRTCLLLIHNLCFLMENIVSLPNDVSLTMKQMRGDTLGEYINTEYEPPGSEEEFVDKYHKVNDEATGKRKISKKKKKNK
nr:HORMA domain-containing protein 1-like [Chelonoidis abingdonii]